MVKDLVVSGTPFELHEIDNVPVHVKREDLCCPLPGPSFSKIRGVKAFLEAADHDSVVGVLDTSHSKAGWGVAYICQALGMRCIDFYPVYKGETGLRYIQKHAHDFEAELVPLPAGRSAILYHQAMKQLVEMAGEYALMMPNALKLQETVEATADELFLYTPESLMCGTWIVSISSGTIAAGVLKGLGHNDNVCVIAHMGYSRSEQAARDYMISMAGGEAEVPPDLVIVDEGYSYKDAVDIDCPFPCNRFYDLKAWKWLQSHAADLEQPIVFWNIGS